MKYLVLAGLMCLVSGCANNNEKVAVIPQSTQMIDASGEETDFITPEVALEISLNDIGLTQDEISNVTTQFKVDDFRAEYEVEFFVDDTEYSFEIDAVTQAITNQEIKTKEVFDNVELALQTQETQTQIEYIGEEKAKEIALAHAGVLDAEFVKIEFDFDNKIAEYEVEFYVGNKEYDYEINAITGAIISYDYEIETVRQTQETQTQSEYIGEAKAKEIALAHAGVLGTDARAIKCNLEREDGIYVYEVDFKDAQYEYEYEINATTGNILKFEKDKD